MQQKSPIQILPVNASNANSIVGAKPKSNRPFQASAKGGFNLIELLVVIAVIAILAAMLIPVLAKAKQQSQGAKCLGNTRQLALAWAMYSSDNREALPNNIPTIQSDNGSWVNGVLSDLANNPDNTNYMLMLGEALPGLPASSSTIGAYTKNPKIYQCPADPVLAPGYNVPRVRSYSMDWTCGSKSANEGENPAHDDYWPSFFKTSDFKIVSKTWILSDEHPDCIDDGCQFTATSEGGDDEWSEMPASYHAGACDFSFADGHSEIHKWMNRSSTDHAIQGNANWLPLVVVGSTADIDWVESHSSPRPFGASNQVPSP